MDTITENDGTQLNQKLDRLADSVSQILINQEKIENKLSSFENKLIDLEKSQIRLETELKGSFNTINVRLDSQKSALDKIPDLAEKVGELKNWKQIAVIVFTAAVTSIAWLLRDGKF